MNLNSRDHLAGFFSYDEGSLLGTWGAGERSASIIRVAKG